MKKFTKKTVPSFFPQISCGECYIAEEEIHYGISYNQQAMENVNSREVENRLR